MVEVAHEIVFDEIDAVRTRSVRLPTCIGADVRRGGVFKEVVRIRNVPWADDETGCCESFHDLWLDLQRAVWPLRKMADRRWDVENMITIA